MSEDPVKKREVLLSSLRATGLYVGNRAADLLEDYHKEVSGLNRQVKDLTGQFDRSEQTVRSQALEIERLKKALHKAHLEISKLHMLED